MNLHAPQSVEAATELRNIAAVPLQIVSPRESAPIVSVVQDTLVGANRFTRDGVLFTKKEAMSLLIHAKRWDGSLPPPVTEEPQPMWSGRQLLSAILPPVSLAMKNSSDQDVEINRGLLTKGTLDKGVFGKQLLHIIYNDYGPDMTVDFLDSLQAMIANFLMNSGFSVGISDLIADDETNKSIREALNKLSKTIEDQILQLHTGLFENSSGRSNQEEFEAKLMGTLNKAVDEAGKIGLASLADTNRMTNMIKAGSKGSNVNVSQMVATLGQQAIEGKRVPNGFQHRTLPHFKRFDDSAAARGFISSSFIKGLQPEEFFFHAMSGREGLIDTAVKTADTGYMQRQIRVALEDLITQHDGSVRDATGNLVQISYGEDGANATKLEGQKLPIGTFTDEKLATEYAADGASGAAAYLAAAKADRALVIEKVFLGKNGDAVRYPVHLDRMLRTVKYSFNLKDNEATVTPQEVLEAQATLLNRTHPKNKLWGALVRWHLRPTLLLRLGYSKVALDAFVQQAVLRHWQSWVEPGQPVGVIAAQSIGEPATQMTLNSVDWHSEIVIMKDGVIQTPRIGEWIDNYISTTDESKIQRLPNDQLYVALDDGHDWKAVSCDEKGVIQWTKLEAITKHPVVNADGTDTILEVTTDSGRIVRATKGKSFLVLKDGILEKTDGSDLKIGDYLPVANSLAISDKMIQTVLNVKEILPPTEWLYGDEIEAALFIMRESDKAGERHWYTANNGTLFTVPYSRSDVFREAFAKGANTRAEEFKPGFVYPKSTRSCTSHIPSNIPLTREFGYFCGAYLAEGSSSTTQIQITNNDNAYLAPIRALLDTWSVGHHTVNVDKIISKTGIKGHSQSLIIHSTLLTSLFRSIFGRISHEKHIPAWVLQAPDSYIQGLIDGYISGDGTVALDHTINFTSVSDGLITVMMAILARYGVFGTRCSRTPSLGRFASVRTHHTVRIPQKYSTIFAKKFTLTIAAKQERLDELKTYVTRRKCKYAEFADMNLDRVKSIKEVTPYGGRMYDVTVAGTRNFLLKNLLAVNDTFHLSGVAAKSNMTRGVPRLKELLKATKKPKATEVIIPLRADLRNKKEEARRVARELEFTLLEDVVTVARIYYDPRDSKTLVAEDADWLAYLGAYEMANESVGAAAAEQPADALAAGTTSDAEGDAEAAPIVPQKSPWILRFELDRERMFAKDITMDDIAFILNTKFSADLETLYTDYNSTRLVFRARLRNTVSSIDDLNALRSLQNKILTGTAVRGIPGLRAVNYTKTTDTYEYNGKGYAPVEQYVLVSDGSNYLEILTHPDVDATKVVSSDIHDMLNNLGIEATRATLYKEIDTLFKESGSSVNYRHVGLLLDKMCHKGRVMSVDRYGINKNDIGPLAKMSFEQTEDIALRAAMFGERDPVLGVSAQVMLGAPIRAGTAFSEILFDEAAAVKIGVPDQIVSIKKGIGAMNDEELEEIMNGDDDLDGPCAPQNLRMTVPMPAAPDVVITETMEDDLEISMLD